MHLCVRVSQIRSVPEADLGWEDMYRERESEPWFDWVCEDIHILRVIPLIEVFHSNIQNVPMTFILVSAAVLNTLYLFSRTKLYQLNLATDPVSSPHASFVPRHQPTTVSAAGPSLFSTILSGLWRAFIVSVRFLLNLSPPKDRQTISSSNTSMDKVQQLEVWTPGELEMGLFAIYSPVHALLWMILTSTNWMLLGIIMFVVGMQVRVLSSFSWTRFLSVWYFTC